MLFYKKVVKAKLILGANIHLKKAKKKNETKKDRIFPKNVFFLLKKKKKTLKI